MKDESFRWIEAGKILAENPNARVVCPEKQDAELVVTDASPQNNPEIIERYMRCPKCGASNSLLIRKKDGARDAN